MTDLSTFITGRPMAELAAQPDPDLSHLDPSLRDAINHATGTSDPVWGPALTPFQLQAHALVTSAEVAAASRLWLPAGRHYDLHIEHRPLESAGPYTGGGNKWCWHITVSPWFSIDPIFGVLAAKRAAPQIIIGGRPGLKLPVVIQSMPLVVAGRALMHTFPPETNRADVTQVEVCARVEDVAQFSDWHYKAFANLVRLTNHTMASAHDVPRELARRFSNTDRFSPDGFVKAAGHLGHMHVPGNDHFDPTTKFKGQRIMELLEKIPDGGYRL